MKKLLTLLFISLSFFGYAQNFLITNNQGTPYIDGETVYRTITKNDLFFGEYVMEFIVINTSSDDLLIKTLRTDTEIAEGMMAYVCFGNCFDSTVVAIEYPIPGGKHEPYAFHFTPREKTGLSKFKFEFWTAPNQSDKFTLYLEINVEPVGIKENMNATASVSAFPNPASAHSKVNLSYTLPNTSNSYNLVIRNIMGASVMSIPLPPSENSISIDASALNSGVYFYAIESKTQIFITKKLIIK